MGSRVRDGGSGGAVVKFPASARRLVDLGDGRELYLCLCCHRPQPPNQFSRNSRSEHDRGRCTSKCLKCMCAKSTRWYREHREEVLAGKRTGRPVGRPRKGSFDDLATVSEARERAAQLYAGTLT